MGKLFYDGFENLRKTIMHYIKNFFIAATLTMSFSSNAYSGGLKESYSYDKGEKKSLIILQVPHAKKLNSHSFLDVDVETKNFGKKYISGSNSHEFLKAGQKQKDERPFDYIRVKAKPNNYIQHLSYTQHGRLVTYCNNLGAYLYDIKPDVVNVISAVKGSYEYTGADFKLTSEAKTILENDMNELMSRYEKVTADVVYVVPSAVVTFENDPKIFGTICPTKPKVFKIEDGNSDAAKVAAGELPSAAPT